MSREWPKNPQDDAGLDSGEVHCLSSFTTRQALEDIVRSSPMRVRVTVAGAERSGRVVSEGYSIKVGTPLYEVILDEPLPDGRSRILFAEDELSVAVP